VVVNVNHIKSLYSIDEVIDQLYDEHDELMKEKDKKIDGLQLTVSILDMHIAEFKKPKTCNGCKHLHNNWAGIPKCYHENYNECTRLYNTNRPDYYEPKD